MAEDIVEKPADAPEPVVELSPTEQEATATGWVPKEQWKGAEEDWVPAKAYLKYGKVESELKRTRAEASQKEKVIVAMKGYYVNVKEDAKKEVIDALKRQKREAVKNEDYTEVAKLDVQLDELTTNLDRKFAQHDQQVRTFEQQQPVAPPPEFYQWNSENTWYTLGGSDELSKEADILAEAYVKRNPNSAYPELLEWVGKKVKQMYPEKFKPSPRDREAADVNEPGEVVDEPRASKSRPKLTAEQKIAAANFGMTAEEYADGLKQWDKQKGIA